MLTKIKLSFLLLVALSINLFSQNRESIKLNEVMVKDSSENKFDLIKPNQQAEFSKSTPELLKTIPGLNRVKRSVFSEEAVINSFKYDQVSTVKNEGCQASSSCPNRMDPITTRISPDDIQEIEIVKGPYELRYGQIMGGMVRIISNQPEYFKTFKIKGSIGAEYQSNGNGLINSFNLNGGAKKYSFKTFANYRTFDNYKSGDGTEIASSYETYSYGLGAGFRLNSKQNLTFDWAFSRANDVMHAGLPMDAKYDLSNMAALNYEYKSINKYIKHLKINIYGSTEEHLMTNENRPNANATLANTPVESQNLGGRLETKLKLSKKFNGFVGIDYAHEQKNGTKEVTIYKNVCTSPITVLPTPMYKEFSVWQNTYLNNMGAFVQFKYFASEHLKFDAGIRANYIQSDILDAESDFAALYSKQLKPDDDLNINYFASFNYQLSNILEFKLAYGQGSRHASLLEKYINHFSVGQDMYEYVGNPNLKSEFNRQVDFTVSKRHKHYYAYANVFFSRVQDYISAEVDTTIPRKFMPCKDPQYSKRFINLDEVQQYGFQLGAQADIRKHFYTKASIAYVHAQNIDKEEPLAETPPLNASLIIGYKKDKFNIELSNEYQAEQDRVASSVMETKTPAFYIMGIKASYVFFKKLNVGIAVDNLLNENYYQHLSRPYKNMEIQNQQFYEPGRNFKVFIKYNL